MCLSDQLGDNRKVLNRKIIILILLDMYTALLISTGYGYKSNDMFRNLDIISLTSTSEAYQNISRIFPLNIPVSMKIV